MTQGSKKTLLIIDDEKIFCANVQDYLKSDRLEVLAAHTGADGIAVCSEKKIDIVLLDQKLPDGEGHTLAQIILEKNDQTKIIFITAYPSFENAVTAVRLGAHDYLSKPFDIEELRLTIENTLRTIDLERMEQVLNYTRDKERAASIMIGNSAVFSEVVRLVARAAVMDAPVLITGETGTGKNLVARMIHYKGPSARSPFISINCAALPENLIEAELFGYEKGAFTGATSAKKGLFEMAEGGTVFLDEISDMPLHLQAKLLSVLEDRTVRRIGGTTVIPISVRIIAATNSEIENALGKTFRKDLYYRLSVIRLHVPPLREHSEDIPQLCSYLLSTMHCGRSIELPNSEIAALMAYDWPGNVRELRNILERALFLQNDSVFAPSLLLDKSPAPAGILQRETLVNGEIKTLAQVEKEAIQSALTVRAGNLTQTARTIGISISTLKRKLREYGLK